MKEFDFCSPKTIKETLELLSEYKGSAVIVAGGTDIVPEINERKINPSVIIDIKKLNELEYIKEENGKVSVGALTTHAALAEDPYIKEHVQVLHTACGEVGSPQIRNLGTIGGNVVTASVAGDGLCALSVLGASVVLSSVQGTRVMALEEFLSGEGYDKRNALREDEMLTEIFFDMPGEHTATAFYKLARRKSLAISVIGGAMSVSVDENGFCTRVSMRGGCLGRYPLQFEEAEQFLTGKKLNLNVMRQTLPMLHDKVYEINKKRPWSVFYKKESVKGVFDSLFVELLTQLSINQEEFV